MSSSKQIILDALEISNLSNLAKVKYAASLFVHLVEFNSILNLWTSEKISRREFIVQSNCAAVGTAAFVLLLSLKLTAGAVSASNYGNYKALVCLFLNGGMILSTC